MSVVLLIIFICISYLVVRIGAIALEMTGMERARARFQALSAFSGTGFTTREAESVVNNPRRRKIVTYLMIMGNAGIVSVIATLILSLRETGVFRPSFNLVIIIVAIFILYRIASNREFAQNLTNKIRKTLRKKLHFEKVQIEELVQQPDGYGVATIIIGKKSKLMTGSTLAKAGFREQDVLILSIERGEEIIHIPDAKTRILAGDRMICYGKLDNLKGLI
jgi:hypothetical protein